MAAFVDATVLAYASTSPDEELRQACLGVLEACESGKLDGRTSTAVVEEIFHLELRGRPPGMGGAARDAYKLFSPLLSVTDEIVADALALEVKRLGANDRIHAATCRSNGIDNILSTDSEFDEVDWLTRVDPRDSEAFAELLGEP